MFYQNQIYPYGSQVCTSLLNKQPCWTFWGYVVFREPHSTIFQFSAMCNPLESNIAGCDIHPAFKSWLTNGCCCCLQSVSFPKRWFDISKFDTVSDECHVLAFLCIKLLIIQGLQLFLVFTRQLIVIVQCKGGIDVLQVQVPFRLMTPKHQIFLSIPVAGAKFVNIWAAIQLLLFPPSCRAWRCFASMMRNDIEEEYLWNT